METTTRCIQVVGRGQCRQNAVNGFTRCMGHLDSQELQAVNEFEAAVESGMLEAGRPKRCECNCEATVNKGRRFVSGHDARLKGMLLRAFDAGDEEAGEELVSQGWKSGEELLRRRSDLADKEQERQIRAERKAAKQTTAARRMRDALRTQAA